MDATEALSPPAPEDFPRPRPRGKPLIARAGFQSVSLLGMEAQGAAVTPRRKRLPPSEWEALDDERLLDLELRDLDLKIEGSALEPRIAELYSELDAAKLAFRPYFWLS